MLLQVLPWQAPPCWPSSPARGHLSGLDCRRFRRSAGGSDGGCVPMGWSGRHLLAESLPGGRAHVPNCPPRSGHLLLARKTICPLSGCWWGPVPVYKPACGAMAPRNLPFPPACAARRITSLEPGLAGGNRCGDLDLPRGAARRSPCRGGCGDCRVTMGHRPTGTAPCPP